MTLDELLADHSPQVEQVTRWALGVLRAAVPDATETVWSGWHGVGFRHPPEQALVALVDAAVELRA